MPLIKLDTNGAVFKIMKNFINLDRCYQLIFLDEKVNAPIKIHKMEPIVLKPLHHRGQECIGIYFERNALLQSLIQKQAGGSPRWIKKIMSNVLLYLRVIK